MDSLISLLHCLHFTIVGLTTMAIGSLKSFCSRFHSPVVLYGPIRRLLLGGTGVSEMSESEVKGPNILPGGSAPGRSMRMSRVAREEGKMTGGTRIDERSRKKDAVMRRTLLPTWRKKLNGAPRCRPCNEKKIAFRFLIKGGKRATCIDLSNRTLKLWPIRKMSGN